MTLPSDRLIRARRRQQRALRCWRAGRFDLARDLQKRALPGLRARPVEFVTALNVLADFHTGVVDHQAGEAALRQAVGAFDELGTAHDDLRAATLRRLGDSLRRQGRHDAAQPVLVEALARSRRRDAHVAALNSLGILAKESGRHADAQSCYDRAMQLVHRSDPAFAALLHNLAGLAHAQSRFADAEPLARQALALHEEVCGAESEDVAADVGILGAILLGQGRHDEAEAHLDRALAFWSRRHGEDHYEVAVTLHNLAALHRARGRVDEAQRAYRRALAIKRTTLGDGHPEVKVLAGSLSSLDRLTPRTSA